MPKTSKPVNAKAKTHTAVPELDEPGDIAEWSEALGRWVPEREVLDPTHRAQLLRR